MGVGKRDKKEELELSQFPVKYPIYGELHTMMTKQPNPRTCKFKTEEIKPRRNILKCILLSIQLPNKLALLTGQYSLSE